MTSGSKAILWAGTLVGVLDIAAAIALRGSYGVPPARVLQGIASGLLGASAYRGGAATVALGLVLHFFIAYVAAAVYYFASRWWPVLVRRAVLSGLAYGVVVHLFMNAIVLPLSRVTFSPDGARAGARRSPPWHFVASMVVIHMVFVGLPISLAIRRYAPLDSGPPNDELQRTRRG